MVSCWLAAALAAATPRAPAPCPRAPTPIRPSSSSTTPTRRSTLRHLPRARRQDPMVQRRSQDAFDQSDELVLETLVPEGPPKTGDRPAVGPGAHPVRHPRPSLRRRAWRSTPAAPGHEGRRRRRHGAAPDGGGRGQAGRGARDASVAARHVRPDAGDRAGRAPRPALRSSRTRWKACRSPWRSCSPRGTVATRRFRADARPTQPNSPDMYRMMFTERNARWAEWIAARMQRPRARCSSRSAPATSPARTACSSACERGISSRG